MPSLRGNLQLLLGTVSHSALTRHVSREAHSARLISGSHSVHAVRYKHYARPYLDRVSKPLYGSLLHCNLPTAFRSNPATNLLVPFGTEGLVCSGHCSLFCLSHQSLSRSLHSSSHVDVSRPPCHLSTSSGRQTSTTICYRTWTSSSRQASMSSGSQASTSSGCQALTALTSSGRQALTALTSSGRQALTALTSSGRQALTSSYRQASTSSSSAEVLDAPYRGASDHGNRIAVCDVLGQHSYRQLLARSMRVSELLRERLPMSLCPHPRHVGLLVPPTSDYIVAMWAVWMAGHVAVPLCPQHPQLQLQYFLQDSCAAAVLCCPSLQQLLPDIPNMQTVVLSDTSRCDIAGQPHQESCTRSSFGRVPADRSALILYTSGTTGDPKGVVLTHGNLRAQMESLVAAWQYHHSDVVLHCLPLHHTHGIINALLTPLLVGARVVMTTFRPCHVWSLLLGGDDAEHDAGDVAPHDHGDVASHDSAVNVFMAVPTMYAKLLAHYRQNYAQSQHKRTYVRATCVQNFRLMVSGSAALPESLLEEWQRATGVTLLERYGMTEIGMALTNPLVGTRRPGYVGTPLPGVRVRIVSGGRVLCEGDETASVVTPGAEGMSGELEVTGPSVFRQYWQRPQETLKEFTPDHWFRTGDTAVYQDGAYKILGRTSVDIIKSGGFKVSALGVERVLLMHPDVADVAVVGAPDPTWGQKICAVLVWTGASPLDTALLKKWLKERLPAYQVPVKYVILEELPRNNMGKVNKKKLLQEILPLLK